MKRPEEAEEKEHAIKITTGEQEKRNPRRRQK